jgi:hypothetical protein
LHFRFEFTSLDNNAMHAKPDLRVELVHNGHFFRLGDLGRYPAQKLTGSDSLTAQLLAKRCYLRSHRPPADSQTAIKTFLSPKDKNA